MIDLHLHSTFSDGSFAPAELVEMASAQELAAIALTDHDTVEGIPEFMNAEVDGDIKRVTGVELSAEFSPGTMHILGYHIDIENEKLRNRLFWIRQKRETRNYRILERLNELGMDLTWEEVAAYAGSDVVGRPHFAQAMIARDYAKDKQEVFNKYLAKGQKAYINRARLSPRESVELINNAGGVAVLAHPVTLKLSEQKLRETIQELISYGLGGIECYYSEFTDKDCKKMVDIANDYGLIMTGGSDFHGKASPKVRMGRGFGGLKVPDKLLGPLCEKAVG